MADDVSKSRTGSKSDARAFGTRRIQHAPSSVGKMEQIYRCMNQEGFADHAVAAWKKHFRLEVSITH